MMLNYLFSFSLLVFSLPLSAFLCCFCWPLATSPVSCRHFRDEICIENFLHAIFRLLPSARCRYSGLARSPHLLSTEREDQMMMFQARLAGSRHSVRLINIFTCVKILRSRSLCTCEIHTIFTYKCEEYKLCFEICLIDRFLIFMK